MNQERWVGLWIVAALALLQWGCGAGTLGPENDAASSSARGTSQAGSSSSSASPVAFRQGTAIAPLLQPTAPTGQAMPQARFAGSLGTIGASGSGVLPSPLGSWAQRVGQDVLPGGTSTASIVTADAIYVAGHFSGTIDVQGKRLTSAGGHDGFVARFDRSGRLQWLYRFGGSGDDRAFDLAIGCGDRLFVVGRFTESLQLGPQTRTPAEFSDGLWLALSSTTGALLRWDQAGMARAGQLRHVVTHPATCGLAMVTQTDSRYPPHDTVIAYTSDSRSRSVSWTFSLEGAHIDDIKSDAQGRLALMGRLATGLAGASFGGTKSLIGHGQYVAQISPKGALRWAHALHYSRPRQTMPERLAVDPQSGMVALTGTADGAIRLSDNNPTRQTIAAFGGAFVVAFSKDGVRQWLRTFNERFHIEGLCASGGVLHLLGQVARALTVDGQRFQLQPTYNTGRWIGTFDGQGSLTKGQILLERTDYSRFGEEQVMSFFPTTDGYLLQTNIAGAVQITDAPQAQSLHGSQVSLYEKDSAFVVLKVKRSGALAWLKRSGTGNSEVTLRASAQSQWGYYTYRLLTFAGTIVVGSKTVTTHGQWRHVLLKQDPQGKLLWAQQFATDLQTGALQMAVGPNGGVTVAGVLEWKAEFNGQAFRGRFRRDGFLAQWSSDGAFVRVRSFLDGLGSAPLASTGLRDISALVHTTNGTITAVYHDLGERHHVAQWSRDLSVLRTHSLGHRSMPTVSLVTDARSNLYLVGRAIEFSNAKNKELRFGQLRLQATPASGGYIARLSAEGTFTWAKIFGERLFIAPKGVAVNPNGYITLAGSFYDDLTLGSVSLKKQNGERADGFLMQLNSNGSVRWATVLGAHEISTNNYYSSAGSLAVVHDASGQIYLYGALVGEVKLGQETFQSPSQGVSFLTKWSPQGRYSGLTRLSGTFQRLHASGLGLMLLGHTRTRAFRIGRRSFALPTHNLDLWVSLHHADLASLFRRP